MASSRIFIRGLPPTLTESDFRKHFGTTGIVTDTKLFPQRRIGYVGYDSPQAAEKAVKYFNRTFIRMSKLAVELARPIAADPPQPDKRFESSSSVGEGQLPRGMKRKRLEKDATQDNEKLREYLNVMQGRDDGMAKAEDVVASSQKDFDTVAAEADNESDDEYQDISRKKASVAQALDYADHTRSEPPANEIVDVAAPTSRNFEVAGADADWLLSKTSRTLELDDDAVGSRTKTQSRADKLPGGGDDETHERAYLTTGETSSGHARGEQPLATDGGMSAQPCAATDGTIDQPPDDETAVRASQRLFLRNLGYDVDEQALRNLFSEFQSITEVHIPIDNKSGKSKGFAYVQFKDSDEAVQAWQEFDRQSVHGRLLHILPAAPKRETLLDDFELSKLPLKKQLQVKRRREASSSIFNWNALYMNPDAIMSSVADRLGVAKSTLLDPTSSDAAVKQAHAETHVIQETKNYFMSHGVNLDAFSHSKRGDTAILVKNFPYDAKQSELKSMFEQHGKVTQFLMPPNGTTAIIGYESAPQARAAFAALAYRKVRNSVLFLERAPIDVFNGTVQQPTQQTDIGAAPQAETSANASELLQRSEAQPAPTATLFVRNLNFSTTTEGLDKVFRSIEGFMSARVKTRTDPKKPGQILSMGFGFLEFRTAVQAQTALTAMDGYNLDGHDLQIRSSHRGQDAAEERRREDDAKRQAAKNAKIVIKNLPFEASKKDVRALVSPFGQLRSVRVPKKMNHSARGFAFAEFTTPKEAENAIRALKDTHLLGRRLAIDYAAEDPEDAEAEIEKMQSKTGSQLNKVEVQKLMGDGRRKFNVSDAQNDEA